MIFDLLCYKTIIKYVYKSSDIDQIKPTKIKPYQEFMTMFFSKTFLNEKNKIESVLKAIQKDSIDIMFIQEANESFIASVKSKF